MCLQSIQWLWARREKFYVSLSGLWAPISCNLSSFRRATEIRGLHWTLYNTHCTLHFKDETLGCTVKRSPHTTLQTKCIIFFKSKISASNTDNVDSEQCTSVSGVCRFLTIINNRLFVVQELQTPPFPTYSSRLYCPANIFGRVESKHKAWEDTLQCLAEFWRWIDGILGQIEMSMWSQGRRMNDKIWMRLRAGASSQEPPLSSSQTFSRVPSTVGGVLACPLDGRPWRGPTSQRSCCSGRSSQYSAGGLSSPLPYHPPYCHCQLFLDIQWNKVLNMETDILFPTPVVILCDIESVYLWHVWYWFARIRNDVSISPAPSPPPLITASWI